MQTLQSLAMDWNILSCTFMKIIWSLVLLFRPHQLFQNTEHVNYLKSQNKWQKYDHNIQKIADSDKNRDLVDISINKTDRTHCDPKTMSRIIGTHANNANILAYYLFISAITDCVADRLRSYTAVFSPKTPNIWSLWSSLLLPPLYNDLKQPI
jgi:hypothetical protein